MCYALASRCCSKTEILSVSNRGANVMSRLGRVSDRSRDDDRDSSKASIRIQRAAIPIESTKSVLASFATPDRRCAVVPREPSGVTVGRRIPLALSIFRRSKPTWNPLHSACRSVHPPR